MRSFEFGLTLASGFAPPAPAGATDGVATGLVKRARHPGRRDAHIDPAECDLLERQEANPTRLAALNCGY